MTAVPGLTPRSPKMVVRPVLVTVVAPRTAKLWAAPNNDTFAIKTRSSHCSSVRTNRRFRPRLRRGPPRDDADSDFRLVCQRGKDIDEVS